MNDLEQIVPQVASLMTVMWFALIIKLRWRRYRRFSRQQMHFFVLALFTVSGYYVLGGSFALALGAFFILAVLGPPSTFEIPARWDQKRVDYQ